MIIKSNAQKEAEALVHQLTEGRLTYLKQCAKSEIKKSRGRFTAADTLPPDPDDVVNTIIEFVLRGCVCEFDGVPPNKKCTRDMGVFLEWLRELIAQEVTAKVLRASTCKRALEQWTNDQASFASIETDPEL